MVRVITDGARDNIRLFHCDESAMTELSAKPNGGALAIAINPTITPSDQVAALEARIADRSLQPKDAVKPSRMGLLLLSAIPNARFNHVPVPTMPRTPVREPELLPVVELPHEIVRATLDQDDVLQADHNVALTVGLKHRKKPNDPGDDEIDLDDDSDNSYQMSN